MKHVFVVFIMSVCLGQFLSAQGNIGIGTSSPGFPLNFSNTLGDKISLWGNSGAHYGFGVSSGLLKIHSDVLNSDIVFGYGSNSSFTETMRIKGNGKIGIGTSTPAYPLNFANTTGDKISLWGNGAAHYGFGIQDLLLQIHGAGVNDDIAFGYGSSASFTEQMRIKGNGKVGIATNAPEFKLDINGRMRLRNSADGTPGTWYNNSDNSAAVSFIGMFNDSHIGIYSGLGAAWNFLMNLTNGNIGIGITPTQKLHVNGGGLFNGVFTASTGSSGATANGNSVGIFEDNSSAYISILTPNEYDSGLLFGNPTSSLHGGILYNTSANPNGMQFRTNGNVNRMVLTNTGLLGLGTTTPVSKFHIKNGNSNSALFSSDIATFESNGDTRINLAASSGDAAGIRFNHPSDSAGIYFNKGNIPNGLRFEIGDNSVAMVITESGWVGIGTSVPSAQLDATSVRFGAVGIGTNPTSGLKVSGNGTFTGTVTASCGVLSCSDIRYKKNIQHLTNSLSHVMSLRGVYYYWNKEKFSGKDFDNKRQIGIIAQELEKAYPELVHTDEDGYKKVDYTRLSPVLLEAIKEQQVMINTQEEKLNTQSAQLKSQQEQIDFLMKELIELKEKTNSFVSREP